MSTLPRYSLDDLKDEKRVKRVLNQFMDDVSSILNGNVDFGSAGSAENMRTFITEQICFTAANAAFSAAHTLGRVPNGYICISCTATGAQFYNIQAQTSATFFVASDTADVSAHFLVL